MTVGEDAEQHELDRLTLSDDGPLDLVDDALGLRDQFLDRHQRASSRVTISFEDRSPGPAPCRFARWLAIRARELPQFVAEQLAHRVAGGIEPKPAPLEPDLPRSHEGWGEARNGGRRHAPRRRRRARSRRSSSGIAGGSGSSWSSASSSIDRSSGGATPCNQEIAARRAMTPSARMKRSTSSS